MARTTRLACWLGAIAPVFSFGQSPDVRLKADISLVSLSDSGRPAAFRSVSPLGRYSTLSLHTRFPNGMFAKVAQRLSTVTGDPDSEDFDEYFLEDPGVWRLGKQYLPFGTGLMRESCLAARIDSPLLIEDLPVSLAVVDEGPGRQFGVSARLGRRDFGLSFAFGRHWGINSTALAVVRLPGEHLAIGSGWDQVLGIDVTRRSRSGTTKFEFVNLSNGSAGLADSQAFDLTFSGELPGKNRYEIGFSRIVGGPELWTRLTGSFGLEKGVSFEPMVRFNSRRAPVLSITMRVRF